MVESKEQIIICKDLEELSTRAAEMFCRMAEEAIAEKAFFNVALSGGSTPDALYKILGSGDLKTAIDWEKVRLFWGDERAVTADHPDSNFRMCDELLLRNIAIPKGNIHRIKGELGKKGASEYEDEMKRHFKIEEGGCPQFDLILLGMGDDGHTASILPGSEVLSEKKRLVTSCYIEESSTTRIAMRITLTPTVILNASNIIVLVTGSKKAHTLKEVLEGNYRPDRYPAQILRKARGQVKWYIDEEAALELS